MQEQINDKTVALSIRSAKMTWRTFEGMIKAYLRHRDKVKSRKQPQPLKQGKQSLKSLKRHGVSLTNVEITGDNIGSFNRIAREHNVDFALKRDESTQPPNWIVFFKSNDSKSLDSALKEYVKINVPLKQKTKKPSIFARMAQIKERIKSEPAPVKNMNRGGHEL